jgi:hypothetical protein
MRQQLRSDNLLILNPEAIREVYGPRRRRIDWRKFREMFVGGAGFALGVFAMMAIVFYLFSGVIE